MTESPWDDGGLTVTLKAGKGFEAAWIVVKGPDSATVRRHLEEATGLSGEGLTLAQLTYNASFHFQSINTVAHGLDAVVIAEDAPVAAEKPAAASESTRAANVAPEAPQAPSEPSLADQVNKETSKAALKDLYLKNKKTFDGDKDLMAVLQARFASDEVS